jgi:2-oxoglutarate/2-oxoacid ferredoxin oxidoreductase subunit alpha
MRLRAFPFDESVERFLESHTRNFIVEQNRDGQLRTLLVAETPVPKDKVESILVYGGFPLSAKHVVDAVTARMGQRATKPQELAS